MDASRIWDCDESSFPTDASKGTVIGPKVSCINFLTSTYAKFSENLTFLTPIYTQVCTAGTKKASVMGHFAYALN